jgi:hypothetical protein
MAPVLHMSGIVGAFEFEFVNKYIKNPLSDVITKIQNK